MPPPPEPAPAPAAAPDLARRAAAVGLIFAATFLAYLPVLRAGFVWDDQAHLTAPALRSLAGLGRIWAEPGATQQYYPLLHSAFWVEHALWGDAPAGYHLVNVALHALAACLFGLVLRRLAVPGALLGALLFALHPVHVESVAWISEQKNTLSAVLYLGSALAWLRFDATRKSSAWFLAFLLFALALGTKTVTATLPAALLVVAWWRHGRLAWRGDVLPLVPWFALGAGAGLFTAWFERKLIGAEGAAFDLTLLQRALLAGRALWFYAGKLLWPAHLTFIYPRWTVAAARLAHWLPLLAALAVAAGCWAARARSRAPLAVLLLFAGTLFPVLGFFNVYPFLYSYVADHFQYLASLGLLAAAAAGLAQLIARRRTLGLAVATAIAATLYVLTFQQSAIYRDGPTLLRTTLARNPDCWLAANNLGMDLLNDKARLPEAIAYFERALQARPAYFEARNNLGLALTQSGRAREAIPHLEEAIRLNPQAYRAHNNLGIALATSGRPLEAIGAFRQAAALNPSLPNIQENWAKALLLLGRREEAAEHFAAAAQLRAPPR